MKKRNWIGTFEPAPGLSCPGFDRLRHIARCPHGCAFCFLEGTYWRGFPEAIKFEELPDLRAAVRAWWAKQEGLGRTGLLNAGELSDSLAPALCRQASRELADLFARQDRHAVLFVTKTDGAALLEQEWSPTPQVIVSFSIAPSPDRAPWQAAPVPAPAAVAAVSKAGWRVRLRTDPILSAPATTRWLEEYAQAGGQVELLTMGSLRYTAQTHRIMVNNPADPRSRHLAGLVRYEQEGESHPFRVDLATRAQRYATIAAAAGQLFDSLPVGLCKETAAAFRLLGWPQGGNPCNCLPEVSYGAAV